MSLVHQRERRTLAAVAGTHANSPVARVLRGAKNAGLPVELHLYAQGGHAFGLRPTKLPITRWTHLVETWLTTIGMTTR